MGFLESAWNWVCGIARRVWRWIASLWDWVKDQVMQVWHVLVEKSAAFCELFSLKLLAKRIRARYNELRGKLSSSDQQELDELVDSIDARG